MLPTKHADADTPASTADYLALAAREPALPPTLKEFMGLLGMNAKKAPAVASAAISMVVRLLQAGVPESPSIQLWLLTAYAPALQAMAIHYRKNNTDQSESESAVVWAFLETLLGLGENRLVDPCLMLEIVRDTQRRLAYHEGFWKSNHVAQVETTPDDSLMADRLPDARTDAYQALQDLIQDMPVTAAERTVLVGLYVYNYSLQELAAQTGEAYKTLQQRHRRLLARLRAKNLKKS